MAKKKQVRNPHFTKRDKDIRDKLIIAVNEKECDKLIKDGCEQIQETWSEADRGRSGNRAQKHVEVTEAAEGQYSQNRKAAIGRPKT